MKISLYVEPWSQTSIYRFRYLRLLQNLRSVSAAMLLIFLTNFEAIQLFLHPISQHQVFKRSYDMVSMVKTHDFQSLRQMPEEVLKIARFMHTDFWWHQICEVALQHCWRATCQLLIWNKVLTTNLAVWGLRKCKEISYSIVIEALELD